MAVRIAPHLHHLLRQKAESHLRVLCHIGHACSQLPGWHALQRLAIEQHHTGIGCAQPQHDGQQRALACAIGAHDGRHPPRLQQCFYLRNDAGPGMRANLQAMAMQQTCLSHTYTLLLNCRSISKNSGTPISAVSTPSGISAGCTMVRATTSAASTRAAPSRAEHGSTTR